MPDATSILFLPLIVHFFHSDYATMRAYAALQNRSLDDQEHPTEFDPLSRAARLVPGTCAASVALLRFRTQARNKREQDKKTPSHCISLLFRTRHSLDNDFQRVPTGRQKDAMLAFTAAKPPRNAVRQAIRRSVCSTTKGPGQNKLAVRSQDALFNSCRVPPAKYQGWREHRADPLAVRPATCKSTQSHSHSDP